MAVVGGGLAGMSAALACADAGARVTLFEASPRLGGATFSLEREGLTVDNGQHVFLRCCTAYRAFLDRLGVRDLVALSRLDVPVLAPGGRRAHLWRAPLPAPLHLTPALARFSHLSPSERLAVLPTARALAALDPVDHAVDARPFGDWLTERGQSPWAQRAFWDLVTVATLNAPVERASLALAATVFQTGLLAGGGAADIGWSRVPLNELHAHPAQRALEAAGGRVLVRRRVRSVRVEPAGGFCLTVADETMTADAVVLAVPHAAVGPLLPPGAVERPERFARLGASGIVHVHVVFDRRVMAEPVVAAVDSPVQWVFDRTAGAGLAHGQYLAVSLSAAEGYLDWPAERLCAVILEGLTHLLPLMRSATVRTCFLTKQPAATFRQGPGRAVLRPPQRTSVRGLGLAGAWTQTGWPATMEGAVRSGRQAADTVLAALLRR
ncbi:MAG: hydroxysqualene dehydroxylase HpnE [Egibacteraceae bacterium]